MRILQTEISNVSQQHVKGCLLDFVLCALEAIVNVSRFAAENRSSANSSDCRLHRNLYP